MAGRRVAGPMKDPYGLESLSLGELHSVLDALSARMLRDENDDLASADHLHYVAVGDEIRERES